MTQPTDPSRMTGPHRGLATIRTRGGAGAFLSLFVFLFACWVLLSDKRDAFHLGQGAFSALLVTFLTYGVMFIGVRRDRNGQKVSRFVFSYPWHRLPGYAAWLLWQILLSNIAVIRVILDPSLPISPCVIRFRADVGSALGRLSLGNSITLTPGTVTLDVIGDEFVVHALTKEAADDVLTGVMRDRVKAAFDLGDAEEALKIQHWHEEAAKRDSGRHGRASPPGEDGAS